MKLDQAPAITFVTNPDDGHGNRLNDIKRAAVEELIRTWRYEEQHAVDQGERAMGVDAEPDRALRQRRCRQPGLCSRLDRDAEQPGPQDGPDQPLGAEEHPPGNGQIGHAGVDPARTARPAPRQGAVITGGSLGIGLQLGRYLAWPAPACCLSARSEGKLAEARDGIVQELSDIGYADPERRVQILAGIDVGAKSSCRSCSSIRWRPSARSIT
jgi:malonyl-CoA reductase/3-hydroxypropionate dehydrogenase (NADP+)